jgi:DNA-binding MarR family transcriptional regulator
MPSHRGCLRKAQAGRQLDSGNLIAVEIVAVQQFTHSNTPSALAARFTAVAQKWAADGPAERAEAARRKLLAAVAEKEPATLNQVAAAVGRGAPAVSRSIDTLVRGGLVERQADPDNRRRLALKLSARGRDELERSPQSNQILRAKFERLAHSELRAVERAVEILERGL